MSAAPLPPEGEGAGTLHARIRAAIEGRILSGEWPPGHRIPFEHELMATFGCSRMTVNKVMSELARKGLVERRRRVGSFVARPSATAAVLTIPDLKAEIAGRGAAYAFETLSRLRRSATAQDRARLRLEQDAPVLAVSGLHRADGAPFALEERLLNLAGVPDAAGADFSADPPGSWLLAHVPWTEAEHLIGAAAADAAAARLLDLPRGAPCLTLERRTWRGPVPLTHVRQVFPAGRYHLTAHFTPTPAGPAAA